MNEHDEDGWDIDEPLDEVLPATLFTHPLTSVAEISIPAQPSPLEVSLPPSEPSTNPDAPFDIDFTCHYFAKNGKKGKKSVRQYRKIADCCRCKKPILDDGRTSYHRYGLKDTYGERNQYFCDPCQPHFTKCPICQFSYKKDDLRLNHCPDCIKQAPQRYIKQYSTKAERELSMKGNPKDELFSGVELELESKDYGFDTLRVHALIKGFAILKRDSSITQGFEIVSAPCSLDVHKVQWEDFFKNLPDTVRAEPTCGMHVHISRVRLSDLQVAKMLKFLHNPNNDKFVTTIAGRPSSFHNDFKKIKNWKDGKEGGRMQADADRHTALNLNNAKTIEFRIFAATLDHAVFLKNIEFCYALVKFTNWGQASITEALQFSAFYKFVHEYRKDYPTLWKFLVNERAFEALKLKK